MVKRHLRDMFSFYNSIGVLLWSQWSHCKPYYALGELINILKRGVKTLLFGGPVYNWIRSDLSSLHYRRHCRYCSVIFVSFSLIFYFRDYLWEDASFPWYILTFFFWTLLTFSGISNFLLFSLLRVSRNNTLHHFQIFEMWNIFQIFL